MTVAIRQARRAKQGNRQPKVVDEGALVLERRQRELAALRASELKRVNLDVPAFISFLLATADKLKPVAPRLAGLPGSVGDSLAALKDCAVILALAQERYDRVREEPPPPRPADDLGRARQLRQMFLADVNALIQRDLLDSSVASSRSDARSARNVAEELSRLATHLRSALPRITGKCAITRAELDEASRLAATLLSDADPRAEAHLRAYHAARDLRARAFTLALRLYADLSRAVRFLEPDEADSLVPSPYAKPPRATEAETS